MEWKIGRSLPSPFPSLEEPEASDIPCRAQWENQIAGPIPPFTDEETAQKCDIVVTVVRAELPPAFLSPFPSAQWERICGSIWPNSECWRHRVLVQNMWPFFPIADDSLLEGPFPLSCLFLNCFSCYWKHLLCGSNIFSEPWGQIAAMWVSMKFDYKQLHPLLYPLPLPPLISSDAK